MLCRQISRILLADLREKEFLEEAQKRLASGETPLSILADAKRGMEIVGKRFETSEYFIPDLVYSGEILRTLTDQIEPLMKETGETKSGARIVIGTVAGDIHDIGKDIVTFMLDTSGYEVFDLGVDIPAARFVDKIRETNASIVCLSGFLTLAYDAMRDTIAAIETAGLRDKVHIMVGGGLVDDDVQKYTRADAWGTDAVEAVAIANRWAGSN